MKNIHTFNQLIPQKRKKRAKKDKIFYLSLPILIEGTNAEGNIFSEYTELSSISSQTATFYLNFSVSIGCKLKLSLDIPKTPILEKPLNLTTSGTVNHVMIENKNKKKQFISICLDKKYKIHPIHKTI